MCFSVRNYLGNAPSLYFQPPVKMRITEVNSFTAQVSYYWVGGFYVSRDGDEVFMYGSTEPGGSQVLQRYSRTGQLLNTWQVNCQHDCCKHLLHLSIGYTPYVGMSCRECKSIRLYSMTDSDPIRVNSQNEKSQSGLGASFMRVLSFFSAKSHSITAYCNSGEEEAAPGAMCHGPDNTIMVSNWRDGSKEVLVYDVTSTQFILKDRIPVHVDQAQHIHYMETAQHGGIVIVSRWNLLSSGNIISAHSLDSKALVWKIEKKEIDGKVLWPCAMCSDPDTEALYVGDGFNERLIVLEPNTGEVIQSIQLPGEGGICNIAWCSVQPHLVIRHDKVTYYNIK